MSKIRIGIVGSGGMARSHAEQFAGLDAAQVVAIASRNVQTGTHSSTDNSTSNLYRLGKILLSVRIWMPSSSLPITTVMAKSRLVRWALINTFLSNIRSRGQLMKARKRLSWRNPINACCVFPILKLCQICTKQLKGNARNSGICC